MKKTKWDIIGKDLDNEIPEYWYDYYLGYWYDGSSSWDYPYWYDDAEYEYKHTPVQKYLNKTTGGRIYLSEFSIGSFIDMNSIYPKSIQREIKINQILGINQWVPTFSDIINKNKDEN